MNDGRDYNNALFLTKTSLDNIENAISALSSPVATVSEDSRKYLTQRQIMAIDKSFAIRTDGLKSRLKQVKRKFDMVSSVGDLQDLEASIQGLRDGYFLSERAYDYYNDLLQTKSERGMGLILRACEIISSLNLEKVLGLLGYETPPIVCFLDRGPGAYILKANISLWDRHTNPTAIIMIVRSAIAWPLRLTAALHEAGHQFAHITNWNKELSEILFNTVIAGGGSAELAAIWSSWTSELSADRYGEHIANIASVLGLHDVIGGNPIGMWRYSRFDPHPIGLLRVLLGLKACSSAFGSGPWDEVMNTLDILYPPLRASVIERKIVEQSIPLLNEISKSIDQTKMKAFSGKSLDEIMPWESCSPTKVRSLLSNDLSLVNLGNILLKENPGLALVSFRIAHMIGGRSSEWIREQMHTWLESLLYKENVESV